MCSRFRYRQVFMGWFSYLLHWKQDSFRNIESITETDETCSLPLAAVKDAGKFMIEIMPLMFIPAGAGLIDAWDALRPICVQIVVIMVVSTIVVMIVSGHVTQFVMRRGKKKGAQQ